jgi:branched-chain amino acid transport system substrate-binding protein
MPSYDDDYSQPDDESRRLSRAAVLKLAGVGAIGSSALFGPRPARAGVTLAEANRLGAQLNRLVMPGGAKAGKGKTFKYGGSLPLSGAGAFFGKEMLDGIHLAIDHIRLAGGASFDFIPKDHKTGNPTAGVQLIRELGNSGVGAVINSYLADFGAEIPALASYKILSIDPGGGTGQAFVRKPYFWGTRASWPDATFPGVYKYVSQVMPKAKRVSLLIWANGAGFINPARNSLVAALKQHGMQLVSTETSPPGNTDFSQQVARLKAAKPDVISVAMSGSDVGYFLKAKQAAGLKTQAIGMDWNPDTAKLAANAGNGYWFAFDYFDPKRPTNPWSRLYASEFKKRYHRETTWLEANYYEGTWVYAQLIPRVLAAGGNINSGEDLQTALAKSPTFKSIYGGDSGTVGTLTLNRETHTIASRQLTLVEHIGGASGKDKVLAQFDIGGRKYKKVANPA